jgi:diguanylate cyclase (GGDEF)-like protein
VSASTDEIAQEVVSLTQATGVVTIDAAKQQLTASAAGRRTSALSAVLVVGSVLGLRALGLHSVGGHRVILHWWSVALIAIIAEVMVVHVEFRREMYSLMFSEMVLVLGLFLATPRDLVVGRMIGEAIFLLLVQRQALRKAMLNLASFVAEVTMLLAVYRLLGQPADLARPVCWLAALAAVLAADLVGHVAVFQVLRWHGAQISFRSISATAAITVPVNTSFALVIGILLVDRPWATLLLAGVGAFLLLSYRSYTSLRQRFDSLSMLYDFTRLVSGAQRPDSVLESILGQAKDLMRAERAEIWLTDEPQSLLRLQVDDNGRVTTGLDARFGEAMHHWFATTDTASIIGCDALEPAAANMIRALGARDCIVAPITESGVVVGLLAVVDRLGETARFRESDRTMFATLANHASVALENGRLIDRLHHEARERRHEALHDALTGLPNRVLFGSRLREQLNVIAGTGARLAVALMDLDGFKDINDTLGHQSGDVVLDEVARRISYAVGSVAVVARLGGDEFALMFPSLGSRPELEAVARRIREEVTKPILVEGMRINVNVSIGFAIAPDDACDAAILLQRADVAMYSAKAGNGNGVDFYEALRDENSTRRLTLGTDLRAAIDQRQLTVAYQPKVGLDDGQVVGMEALVRWRHPVFGQVMPDEFIPLAERTGIITELTAYVLQMALEHARTWHEAGHMWTVAVNVAMRNLLDGDFAVTVGDLLAKSGVDPSLLTLEITETGVMSDPTRTIDMLDRLAALGLRLSIDDFGTGYSSLSYLQQLPVTEIKIDKVFVGELAVDPSAEAIVRSVLDLARNLHLSVVAEGVEDRRTWEHLRTLGCDMAQGYFLARPMPFDDVLMWLKGLAAMDLADRRIHVESLAAAH